MKLNITNKYEKVRQIRREEIWKPVRGYEGRYEVSNHGKVRSIDRETIYLMQETEVTRKQKGQLLKIKKNEKSLENTYLFVTLFDKESNYKHMYIHRLVAEAFLNNPKNKKTVNHINGDKTDNYIANLEYSTISENVQHAYDSGLRKRKISNEDAIFIKENYPRFTQKELAELFDVTRTTIQYTLNKRKIYYSEELFENSNDEIA